MKLTLQTERLILRPFETSDAEAMFRAWASDPEVTKYLNWNAHESVEETRAVLEKWAEQYKKPERLNFAIELKDTHELIGGIDVVGYLDERRTPVIGYNLARKHWNHGYMTEACRRVLEELFSRGYRQVRIDAVRENAASNAVIRKCGGEFIGADEEYFECKKKTFTVNRYLVKNPAIRKTAGGEKL